jgi:hypothetical protein
VLFQFLDLLCLHLVSMNTFPVDLVVVIFFLMMWILSLLFFRL